MRFTYKITLRGDRVRSDGTQMLILQVFVDGKRVRIPLEFGVKAEAFNPKTQQVKIKGDAERTAKINAVLAGIKNRIEDIHFQSIVNKTVFTADDVVREFDRRPVLGNFVAHMEREIAASRGVLHDNTIKAYNTVLRHVRAYQAQISFSELTTSWVMAYDAHLRKKKLDNNTRNKHHQIIRKFLLLAKKQGKRIENPYNGFSVRWQQSERTYLNAAEVAALYNLYQSGALKQPLQHTLRHFLFQCGSSVRYSDLAALNKSDIEAGFLKFKPQKTAKQGKVVRFKLSDMALRMVADSESTTDKLFRVPREQVMNRFLKQIGDEAGMSKKLTTHVGRHSFGYLFIAAGGQVEVLQQVMGHSDIKTTMIYTHIDSAQIIAGVDRINRLLSAEIDG